MCFETIPWSRRWAANAFISHLRLRHHHVERASGQGSYAEAGGGVLVQIYRCFRTNKTEPRLAGHVQCMCMPELGTPWVAIDYVRDAALPIRH